MSIDFLGLKFHELKLEDQGKLEPFLTKYPQPLTGYTFATLFSWNEIYKYAWAFLDNDTLLISCIVDESGERQLLQPVGAFPESSENSLLERVNNLPYNLRVFGVNSAFVKSHLNFVSNFNMREDRGGANYIYSTEYLATLSGKKLQKKRNLISQAQRLYEWTTESVTAETVVECKKILKNIRLEEGEPTNTSLESEMKSVEVALDYFGNLKQSGILVRIGGEPVAFSIFERLDESTAVVHVEKALRAHKGLYQVINQATAIEISRQGIPYINREEDLNNEGLRQAKLSYYPAFLREAFLLCTGRGISIEVDNLPCERAW